jgi:hypothetical protein
MEHTLQELETLLQYLVKHNEEHAAELMQLADQARALEKQEAYGHLTQGVEQLSASNRSLRAALAALEVQHVSR